MTRFLVLLLLCLCLKFEIKAQYLYPKLNDARLIQQRTLAVQLLPEDTEVETALNTVLKEAFNENYQGKVVFKSPSEIKALKKVIIVAHAGVIRTLLSYINNVDLKDSFQFKIGYGEVLKSSINEFEK